MMKNLFLLITLLCFCKYLDAESPSNERKAKFLFNVVKFRNTFCISQLGGRRGTCYTSSQCNSKSGMISGTCAAGFGVCCLFFATSGDVSENCTYLRNENFPSALTDVSQAPTFTIRKCSNDVCAVRLDFESFTIRGPGNTAENAGVTPDLTCQDTLTITSTSGAVYPVICGQNTGQHVYVEMGAQAGGTATLSFAFTGTADRTYEIKATQIPCSASWRNPLDCFQYFTGTSGRFTTFNFLDSNSIHLPNQRYSACIRQEVGYCCVEYQQCSDPNSFSLNVRGLPTPTSPRRGRVDEICNVGDYVVINGASNICTNENGAAFQVSKICGSFFTAYSQRTDESNSNAVCDCTEPFNLGIFTDAMNDITPAANDVLSRGVCLEWRQIPCAT